MKILTFDIEDWFHILDNTSTKSVDGWNDFESRIDEGVDRILEMLDVKKLKASFFCLGWIAERYPQVVRKIFDCGHEIGSHSFSHQLVYEQSQEQFKEDLRKSVDILESIIGRKVISYRAPGFSITEKSMWAFEILMDCGIKIDSSVFPAKRAHGGLDSFGFSKPFIINCGGLEIKEFPINTRTLFGKDYIYSGGGYFRILPKFYLKSAFANDDYIMTYFHPRDFDKQQPMVPNLSMARKFKSYVGINGAFDKLCTILDENDFVSLGNAVDHISWSDVEKVYI
ncbi:polysaccharide deacetylase family protein [Shewanella algae]|uniref:polysaccharide deacetylase family protein n=1 Tax=Shewanella algae TaxID=38313 RepID=UPI001183FBEA|nr:polysaccharide deacetylase family protein [Shewanella algae]TVO82158.1 polysaccharide deacetylase [Shewanella algae]TVO83296.1 polysaccharide deacetylase [Shewanella algae]TVO87701.1 polysaccharide deacetylase [Shewanella algae]TVO94626.1 polysaccharide deacetylase [Shewanella algae]TXS85030.1 polysaccharide deacetylase [Shewanella algae]